MRAFALAGGYAPAQTPTAPADMGDVAPQVQGVVLGHEINTDAGNVNHVVGDGVAVIPAGSPPMMQPTAPPSRLVRAATHSYQFAGQRPPEEVGTVNHGGHVQMGKGVRTPAGTMLAEPAHRNTFRASPQPWDAGVFVGMPTDTATS